MNTFHRFLSSFSVKAAILCAAFALLAPTAASAYDAYVKVGTASPLIKVASDNTTSNVAISQTAGTTGTLSLTSIAGGNGTFTFTPAAAGEDVTIRATQIAGGAYCEATPVTFSIRAVSAVTVGTQPTAKSCIIGTSPAPQMTVAGSGGSGSYTYQWWVCDDAYKTNDEEVDGAELSSYAPSTAAAHDKYYYCVITDANVPTNTVETNAVRYQVTSCLAAPSITCAALSIPANRAGQLFPSSDSPGAFSYALPSPNGKASVNASSGLVTGSNSGAGTETVKITQAAGGDYCANSTGIEVTVTVTAAVPDTLHALVGRTYDDALSITSSSSATLSATSGKGNVSLSSPTAPATVTFEATTAGKGTISVTQDASGDYCSDTQTFPVHVVAAITASDPSGATYAVDAAASDLSVTPSGGSGAYAYQWYSCTAANKSGSAIIPGETSATYDGSNISTASEGHQYYYCIISEANASFPAQNCTTAVADIEVVEEVAQMCYEVTATWTSTSATTITGAKSGGPFGTVTSAQKSLQEQDEDGVVSSPCNVKRYKLNGAGAYVALNGTFKIGDTVTMVGNAPNTGFEPFQISNGTNTTSIATPLFDSYGNAACGTYRFVLTANTSAIYFYRANKGNNSEGGDDQNPCIRSITVKRCCDSVGVADLTTSQAVACGANVTLAPIVVGATSYQWYTCSNPADSITTKATIGGATENSYTVSSVSALNNYFLIASNAAGCADTSNVASIAPNNGAISVTLAASDPILDGETENVTLPSLEVGYSATHFAFVVSNTASSGTTLLPCFAHTQAGSGIKLTTLTSDEEGASVVSTCGSITGGSSTTYYLQIPAGLAAGTYNGSIVITDSRGASACAQGLTLNYSFSVKVPIHVHFTGSCLTPITSNAGASVTIGGNTTSGTDTYGVITVYADPDTEASLTASVSGKAFKWWDNIEHSTSNPYAVSVESTAIDIYVNFTDARSIEVFDRADSLVSTKYSTTQPAVNTEYGSPATIKLSARNLQNTYDTIGALRLSYNSDRYVTYSSMEGDLTSLTIKSRLKKYNATNGGVHLYIQPYSTATASSAIGDPIDARYLYVQKSNIWEDSLQTVELPNGTKSVNIYFGSATSGDSKYEGYISYLSFALGSGEVLPATSHITPKNGTTDVDTTSSSTIVVALGNKPYWSNDEGGVDQATIDNVASHIRIKRYNGSEYVVATTEFTATATAWNDPDTEGSEDSIRVVYRPGTPTPGTMYGGTRYQVEISGLVNCEGEEVTDSISSIFDTEAAPVPVIGVFNANKSSVADASVSFGTIFHKAEGATVTKVYGITNVGTGVLRIDSVALSGYYKGGATDYYRITKVQYNSETPIYNNASGKRNEGTGSPNTNLYSKTLSASDTLYVSVAFSDLPAGGDIGNYLDTLRVFANVSGGVPEVASRSVKFTTSVGGFVLPYTYQSGLANPVISATELKQDYATTDDVPSEIILPTAGISGLVPEYNVYSSEGACSRNGQSALRVGSNNAGHNDYSLKIRLNHATNGNITGKIGTLTIGWSAAGSRKLLVTSEDGATEYYATGWLSGRRCYTHSVDIHNCTTAAETGSTSIRVQLFAADTSALSTINYINITPCDPEYISSKCDILGLTASCTDGSFQKADSMIVLRADTTAASACGLCSGATYTGTTLTATHIDVSPGATVSPSVGTPVEISPEGYYVYTVTAEDGITSKNFYVSVQCPVSGESGACYGDTITYSINMDKDDKTLHVLYAGEGNVSGDVTCLVPVADAVNSTYTIHYLTDEDKPAAYVISGPTSLCVGSTGEYRLSNAPESNNPKYSWTIGVLAATPAVNSFSIAGADSTSHYSPISKAYNADSLWYYYTGEVLRLQSPTMIAEGTVKVDLKINLGFEDEKCEVIAGRAELNVFASMLPPTSVKSITADCKLANGNLEIRAIKPTVGDSLVVVDAKNTYPVISATSYGFDFVVNGDGEEGDLLERSMSVNDTTVTVALAKTSPNLDVVVLAKNGCGTIPSDTLEVSYGSHATTWTGAVDGDWDKRDNWTAQVPKACTDAYIPQLDTTGVDVNDIAYTVENYPVVSADAECDSIVFLPGGGAKGLQNLSYNRAIVQQTFDRDRWYTLTAPLHQMYTGDYYYTGRPSTNLKFYNTANPDNSKNYNLQFTSGIVGLNYDLYPGNGFAYRVDTFSYVGKFKKSSSRTPQSVSLPRSTESGILVPSYYKFSTITGGALGSPYAVTRTGNLPYRLAFDQNATTGAADFDPIDTTLAAAGYHLIGNPLMTHLNFATWQGVANHGSNVDATMWIWNNHYNSTTSVVTGEALPLGASAAANKVVPPAQAFFVHTTANNKALRFDPTQSYFYAPASGTANIHMRADESKNTLYIVADDGTTKSFASLRNSELANNDFVRDEDAEKLFSAHTLSEIYTLTNGHAVDINQFNADNIDIPVGVRNSGQKAEEATTHLTFDGAESFENQSVYLLNTLTGDSVDLKLQNTYEFKYDSAHQEGVLYLVFRSSEQVDPDPTDPNAPTDVEEVADNSGVQITVHGGNTVRVLSSMSDPIREIDIFSASGARIVKLSDVNASTRDVQLNAGQRTVVVRAVTDNTVTTKEVLIY